MINSHIPDPPHGGRNPKKESVWRALLSHQQRSGLSVRQFCFRKALSEASFYSWRREIRRRDAQRQATQSPAPAFVELRPAPMPLTVAPVQREAPLELLLSDDRRLLIHANCDPALLRQVLDALTPASIPAVALSNRPAAISSNGEGRSC